MAGFFMHAGVSRKFLIERIPDSAPRMSGRCHRFVARFGSWYATPSKTRKTLKPTQQSRREEDKMNVNKTATMLDALLSC
jgi:hypothetical protein